MAAFIRGFYKEILPEPLVEGKDPSALVRWLFENYELGCEYAESESMISLAFLSYHQWRLSDMFDHPANKTERALAEAVANGQPINIAPACFLSSTKFFQTFAPVFRQIKHQEFAIGIQGQGRYEQIQAETPGEAMKRAVVTVSEWASQEVSPEQA